MPLTEATGLRVAVLVTGVNRNDVTQLLPLIHTVPAYELVMHTRMSPCAADAAVTASDARERLAMQRLSS